MVSLHYLLTHTHIHMSPKDAFENVHVSYENVQLSTQVTNRRYDILWWYDVTGHDVINE